MGATDALKQGGAYNQYLVVSNRLCWVRGKRSSKIKHQREYSSSRALPTREEPWLTEQQRLRTLVKPDVQVFSASSGDHTRSTEVTRCMIRTALPERLRQDGTIFVLTKVTRD